MLRLGDGGEGEMESDVECVYRDQKLLIDVCAFSPRMMARAELRSIRSRFSRSEGSKKCFSATVATGNMATDIVMN